MHLFGRHFAHRINGTVIVIKWFMLLFRISAHISLWTLSLCRLSTQFVFIKYGFQDLARSPPITLPIASALSLRNSRTSIMGLYSPYLGDLNGFSSLNLFSSLMGLCSEVLTLFTADPQAHHGKCSILNEDKVLHEEELYTHSCLTCLFLRFVSFSSSLPISSAISQTYLLIHFHACVNTDSFNHTLIPTLNAYLSHV